MRSPRQALLLFGLLQTSTAPVSELACGECIAIQEAIHTSINRNITALQKQNLAGTTVTATVEIGQIIWRVCESNTWTEARHQAPLTTACTKFVEKHTDLATSYWKEKSSDEYEDKALALRMKRAVCTNEAVGACTLDMLPSDYEPLRPDECEVCKAVVGDVYGIIANSRDRPTEAKKSDAYFRLVGDLQHVCDYQPMRRAIRSEEREAVREMCEDIWDEHEGKLVKMVLNRSEKYAAKMCADELDLCDSPMAVKELFAHDPWADKEHHPHPNKDWGKHSKAEQHEKHRPAVEARRKEKEKAEKERAERFRKGHEGDNHDPQTGERLDKDKEEV